MASLFPMEGILKADLKVLLMVRFLGEVSTSTMAVAAKRCLLYYLCQLILREPLASTG